jgi:hypothetical protein
MPVHAAKIAPQVRRHQSASTAAAIAGALQNSSRADSHVSHVSLFEGGEEAQERSATAPGSGLPDPDAGYFLDARIQLDAAAVLRAGRGSGA